jgi:hypothetical protein
MSKGAAPKLTLTTEELKAAFARATANSVNWAVWTDSGCNKTRLHKTKSKQSQVK